MSTISKCSIPPDQLEALASDRVAWKCEEGLTAFDINYDQEAEARRARRHTITSTPASGPRCYICGRICASEFGLRSHLRSHRPSVSYLVQRLRRSSTDNSKQASLSPKQPVRRNHLGDISYASEL